MSEAQEVVVAQKIQEIQEVPNVAVLILCAGKLFPWEGNAPYHFRPIAGKTILGRIIYQAQNNNYKPIIVTHRDDIRAGTSKCQHFEPKKRRTIAETWLNTRELWSKQTIILFGDTVFGTVTIKNTLGHRGVFKAIGNSAEIFAFSFSEKEHDKVADILFKVNEETTQGSPWLIYRRWCGFSYASGQREKTVFQWIWDRTADVDSQSEYNAAVRVWGK